ncbi:helix-turn-helix domain-containing protein [Salibacterium aidingense]|uniref:helix-turn-helix domain-containing protein n=1 Tax=Salibacterium aidingense TaxID=384933 RepID=UPI003BC3EE9D
MIIAIEKDECSYLTAYLGGENRNKMGEGLTGRKVEGKGGFLLIGERIVRYRMKKDMSIHDLAARTDISLTYLHDIEQNRWLYPSVQYVEKIAAALDVQVHDILGPKTEKEAAEELDEKWLEVVREAMSSYVSKEQFKEFLDAKKREKERKQQGLDYY